MTRPSSPIRLITIVKIRDIPLKMEPSLYPDFVYSAIVTSYSKQTIVTLLETLNPTPNGILVGGGFDQEVADEVAQIVAEWNEGKEDGATVRFVRVAQGKLHDVGVEGLTKYVRDALRKEFGVE